MSTSPAPPVPPAMGPKKSPAPGTPSSSGTPNPAGVKSPLPPGSAPQVGSKMPVKKMPPPGVYANKSPVPGAGTPIGGSTPGSATPTGAKSPMPPQGGQKFFKKAPPPAAVPASASSSGPSPAASGPPSGAVSPTPSGKRSPGPFAGKKSPMPPNMSGEGTPIRGKSPMAPQGKKMLPRASAPPSEGTAPSQPVSRAATPPVPLGGGAQTGQPNLSGAPKGPPPGWKGPPPGWKGPPPGWKGPPPQPPSTVQSQPAMGTGEDSPTGPSSPPTAAAPSGGWKGPPGSSGTPPGWKGPPPVPATPQRQVGQPHEQSSQYGQQQQQQPFGSPRSMGMGPGSPQQTLANISAIGPPEGGAPSRGMPPQQGEDEMLSPAQAARKRLMMMRLKHATRQEARRSTQPLTVDPRSGLPIIDFPNDRQRAFSHLGTDIVLHIFLDCDRISSKGNPLRRVVFVTDRTLFVCEDTGGVLRCVQVNKISLLNRANDNSNEIALVIPSEYDIILRLDRKQHMEQLISVLKAVHLRMVSKELNVQTVKEIRPSQYRMAKPPGFQLQNIPPRSRAHLQKALEAIELQQEERNETILSVQRDLEQRHQQEVLNKKGEIKGVEEKLKEALERQKAQKEDLEKLTAAFAKCKKRREEIDSQLGVTGQAPINKDVKIKELQEIVETLTASVQKASEERQRLEEMRRGGDFEQRDVDFFEADAPRLRGRSLHYQGLIEVMQRQILDRENEIVEFTARQVALQNRQLDLKRKEEQLRELEQLFPTAMLQNNFAMLSGPTAAEMLDGPGADTSYLQTSSDGGIGAYNRGFGRATNVSSRHIDPSISFAKGGSASYGLNDSRAIVNPDNNDTAVDNKRPEIVATLAEFTEDPRTRLKFAVLSEKLREKFPQLYDAVMFFFNEVIKINKRGDEQRRFVAVTDRAVILFGSTGAAIRNIPIKNIERLEQDTKHFMVLIHPGGANEYDMLLKMDSQQEVDAFCRVIKKCSDLWDRERTSRLQIIQSQIQQNNCRLEKPHTYEVTRDCAIQKREVLFKILQDASRRFDSESQRKRQAHLNENREAEQRIRQDLMPEMALRHEREFHNLRKMLNTLDTLVREKQQEERLIIAKIENHRCAIGNLKPSASFPEDREYQGQYWIPSDPVQIECRMEILHIQFYDDWVITSHPNGFINVWQISTADLYRTLKTNGHTARVQTFFYDGRTLISGGFDSSIRKWSLAEGLCTQFVHHAHEGPVTCLQFDPQRCVTSGGDCKIVVWDTVTLKKKRTLTGHRSSVVCFKFEGNTLASADWGWVFIWDLDRGIVLKTLRDDNGGIMSLDLSGVTLLTGGTGGVLTVWNINTTESDQLDGHTDDIHCVQLQGNFAVSSSSDGRILMWQVKDFTSLGIFHDCSPRECKRFHFKANRFVVGEDTVVKVWTR